MTKMTLLNLKLKFVVMIIFLCRNLSTVTAQRHIEKSGERRNVSRDAHQVGCELKGFHKRNFIFHELKYSHG